MRKLLPILSALILGVMMIIPVHALAEDEDTDMTVRIYVSSASGEVGAKVDVPVMLYDCEQVDSIEFNLNYDSNALSVISVTPGDLFPAEYCVSNADTPGYVSIACACRDGLEGSGTLLTVRFEILNETGSALTVTTHKSGEYAEQVVSYIDADYNQYFSYVSVENGSVTVGSAEAPEPLVTPWIPATPVPTPTAVPEATDVPLASVQSDETETTTPEPSAESRSIADVDPIAYIVVGGLFVVLIILIVITVTNRRKAGKNDDKRLL
jgi:hypothetical protein